ncbi:hypothetical protein HDU93_003798 [Gonapodya sp. JEL0774]|nr:hypothetical protein HDU93_003798 [Gonapodya sp. JEL0774]
MTSTLVITPLPRFGASVSGVHLSSISDAEFARIEDAFHTHALLVFPGANISPTEQAAFAKRIGRIEYIIPGTDAVRISNKTPEGNFLSLQDHQAMILKGNEGWHTDSSYQHVSALASFLSCHAIPSAGGSTEWADCRAAYDNLASEAQSRIEKLSAFHSLLHSQAKIGHQAAVGSSYGMHQYTPPLRPLVKVHPRTGRKALYIGRHAFGIPGLPDKESERLLDDLVEHATQPQFVHVHQWKRGDAVLWDNRCLLHRARPYAMLNEERTLWHVRIRGEDTERSLNANEVEQSGARI